MYPHEIDLLEAQRRLEDESRAIGQARYRNQRTAPWVDAFGPLKDEGALPPGREIVRQAIKPTAEAITAFLASAATGRAGRRHSALALLTDHKSDPAALAYLTLRCGIQAASQNLRVQKAAGMVARAIKDHLQAVSFKEVNSKGAAGLQRSLAGRQVVSAKRQQAIGEIHRSEGVGLTWSQQEELQLGLKFLELAAEATDIFRLELIHTRQGKSHKREQQVQITDVALEWLEKQHSRCELLDPLPLPMVVVMPW